MWLLWSLHTYVCFRVSLGVVSYIQQSIDLTRSPRSLGRHPLTASVSPHSSPLLGLLTFYLLRCTGGISRRLPRFLMWQPFWIDRKAMSCTIDPLRECPRMPGRSYQDVGMKGQTAEVSWGELPLYLPHPPVVKIRAGFCFQDEAYWLISLPFWVPKKVTCIEAVTPSPHEANHIRKHPMQLPQTCGWRHVCGVKFHRMHLILSLAVLELVTVCSSIPQMGLPGSHTKVFSFPCHPVTVLIPSDQSKRISQLQDCANSSVPKIRRTWRWKCLCDGAKLFNVYT